MGVELLFLLLPIAALSGWLVGRRDARDRGLRGFVEPDVLQRQAGSIANLQISVCLKRCLKILSGKPNLMTRE